MRASIYKDFVGMLAGAACAFASVPIFAALTHSIFSNGDKGYDREVINFTQYELQNIFLTLTFLCCGLVAGLIAKRRGFLIGLLASLIYSLTWYIHAGLGYHPIFTELQWINAELASAIGWGIQSGVCGIAGVSLALKYSRGAKHAS